MKQIFGIFKLQSLVDPVIQLTFDHFNFLVVDSFHRALLGRRLAQKTIEVLAKSQGHIRPRPRLANGHDCILTLALRYRNDGFLMVDTDHRVAFLMTNLLESFNVCGALAQGFAVGDLPDDRGLAMSNQTGNLASFNLA